MKRITILIIALCCALPTIVQAQQKQQHAIVKTRGRQLDDGSIASGRRISEVVVDVKGTGKILSDDKGELSFGVSVTSGYHLTNVTKEGYMLSDLDVISKQHQYQAQPVDILLESVEELNAYRRSIERKVRRNYQNQLDALADRIDSLENVGDSRDEEISRLRAELDRAYDEAEQYVDMMTEYYLNIDFDRETDFDIEISYYIINGMLDKADSLLATRGNIEERVRQNRMAQQAVERDKEMVAKDCYRKYEIASQRLERDTATYYLKLRAELDPTNIDWQIDAASYLRDIIADYDQALSIYESALSYSLDHYGEYHVNTVLLYNNISTVYYCLCDFETTLVYLYKVLSIAETITMNQLTIANIYSNIGKVYEQLDEFDKSLIYQEKSLCIKEKILDKDHIEICSTLARIGSLHLKKGDYNTAFEYFNKVKVVYEDTFGEEHLETSSIYNNLGVLYSETGNYKVALDYYKKSLKVKEKIYGTKHPECAITLNNIGITNYKLHNYQIALDCFDKALNIFYEIFGSEHPEVASSYNNISAIYENYMKDYTTALEYSLKSVSIYEKILGVEHTRTAMAYTNISGLYSSLGDYDTAFEYINKAVDIYEKTLGIDHPDTATAYNSKAHIYFKMGDNNSAMEYLKKVLAIRENVLGYEHPYTATAYTNIAATYESLAEYEYALEYFANALEINRIAFGNEHNQTALSYYYVGDVYYKLNDYKAALEYYQQSLDIFKRILPAEHSNIVVLTAKIEELKTKIQ